MPLEFLKSLTGGTASSTRANCKSYGSSYQPRDDVQIVITSNLSPYEVYGKYDAKTGRRFMSQDIMAQLEERFYIHRIDNGPLEEDRIRFTEPANWSVDQFKQQLCKIFEPKREDGADNTDHRSNAYATQDKILAVFENIKEAKSLLYARYSALDRTKTGIAPLCDMLDKLPIHIVA